MIGIIVGILLCIFGLLFVCGAMILNSWLDENDRRYHLFDYLEEGDDNGETDTR